MPICRLFPCTCWLRYPPSRFAWRSASGAAACGSCCAPFLGSVGMTAAWLAGLIDQEKLDVIARISWVELPHPAVSFGFDLSLLPAFLAAGAACAFRAIGVVTTCQRINNAAWRQPDMVNIRKGVLPMVSAIWPVACSERRASASDRVSSAFQPQPARPVG